VLIRHADPAGDGAACAAVYAPYVIDGVASLEERAPEPHEMSARIEQISLRYPWLVAEVDQQLIGYAYGSPHHVRASYRWAADTTVYIAGTQQRRGVGRALYGALLPLLARQGLYVACAGITLPNPASVALHEAFGFEPVGVYRGVGFKHGEWWSVGWWQATLLEPMLGQAPAEPGPPVELRPAGGRGESRDRPPGDDARAHGR
jgi:L-amino acid N-acyltransferase YncA